MILHRTRLRGMMWLILLMGGYFLTAELYGQSVNTSYQIIPFIKNFDKTQYKGANQNWSATQSGDGYIYVANRLGLLEYNGRDWKVYPIHSSHPIRSVLAASDNRIYYGHFQDFGYFKRNEYGVLDRFSLSDSLLHPEIIKNEDIWSIHEIGGKVYFRSFGKIYIYDGEQINVISASNTVFTIFEIDGLPYVNIIPDGIFLINNQDDLQKVSMPRFLAEKRIINVIPAREDLEIIVTEFNGLYLKENREYRKWRCPADDILKELQLNKCISINDSLMVIGTIGSGLYIINDRGNIVNILNKGNGLQNNTVLALMKDLNDKLWVCLDNGIDYVEINSPYLYCIDQQGTLGSVYSAEILNDKLYLGTNQGLFYADWTMDKDPFFVHFSKVEEVQGQVWEIKKIDDKIICNYNLGVLEIDENGIRKIGDVGGFTVTVHPNLPDIFYQGNYTGILQFKRNSDGHWNAGKWIHQSTGGTRFLQIDQYNNLWAGQSTANALKFELNRKGDSIVTWKEFGSEQGIDQDWNVGVFTFANRIILNNNDQFFSYDYTTECLESYTWLNEMLGNYRSSVLVYQTGEKEYWFATQDNIGRFIYNGSDLKQFGEINNRSLLGSAVENYQNISKIDGSRYLVGMDNGFMIYQSERKENDKRLNTLRLNHFSYKNNEGQTVDLDLSDTLGFEIENKPGNISLDYSIPGLLPEDYTLEYQLNGGQWLVIRNSSRINFNYLQFGHYTLSVRAKNTEQKILDTAETSFRVLPPWFLSFYALSVYFFILGLAAYGISYYLRIRSKKQQLAYLKKLKSDNTRRIIRMKNASLKKEVASKSTQLVNYTVLLKNKNETLITIREMVDRLRQKGVGKSELNQIYRTINQSLSYKDDWKLFSAHFDEAHNNFLRKMKTEHEDLTSNDLQLCAYLKMNLSSKEIASLLNISTRSVEVKRYRLRKKLGLKPEDSLTEEMMKF